MSLVRFSKAYPSLLDRFFDDELLYRSGRKYSNSRTTVPSVNIRESENEFEVEVAAPGFEKNDFRIELKRDLLNISTEKKIEKETKEGQRFTTREFSYQSFSRSFTLPNIADNEKISAKYEKGILTITIPKKEEVISKMNRMIEIN